MPCNQFMRREPGHIDEIKAFTQSRGFVGTVMEKGDVNGPNAHPVWVYLKVRTAEICTLPSAALGFSRPWFLDDPSQARGHPCLRRVR